MSSNSANVLKHINTKYYSSKKHYTDAKYSSTGMFGSYTFHM